MEPGKLVRLKADPGRIGVITGRTRTRGDNIYWQIRFPDRADYYRNIHFEVISDEDDDPIELLRQGKLGRAKDLRGNLTHIRLSGRLANLIYSMGTTHTDFYPYQFKPVLNFLDSPGNGLLIADEVGLGKTIEAGLIWTELRSRYDIRRVMVLCPAMLQPKWQEELRRRFGIDADILGSADVLRYFREFRDGDRNDCALICSMQGLRPRRGWDRGEERQDSASQLARFLDEIQYDEPILNLIIIDEAHYLRNPESMTSRLGRLLRDVSEHVVLLSATPIHLRNLDLYQLLNLVDEHTFNQPQVFDDILAANEPLLRARDAVLQRELQHEEFIAMMEETRQHPFFESSRQIRSIIEAPQTSDELKDRDYRTSLANRLEGINLLGRTVARTRKRDVESWRVIREVVPEMVPLSEAEQEFYAKVTELICDYALRSDGHEAFLLVMPQRQMSSSMPAAIEEWQRRGRLFSEQLFEDLGIDELQNELELGPLTSEIVKEAMNLGDPEELRANDSKYHRLLKMLKGHVNRHPNEKIILFAYFRPTLRYLQERLTEDGLSCITLMGGGDVDKHEIIRQFAQEEGPQILLSSEVASEGVDLQFARFLINYDLPWNPMKVEQRIGRIDRIGQKADTITIWNLFYEDTIDARIYNRLYERLDIFRRALGDLEAVLGDEIRKLTTDLLLGRLTPEQEIARIEQTEQALSNLRAQEEKLEEEASSLVAHGDYILHQVQAARELQRNIIDHDIYTYVYDFISKEYVGSEFVQLDPNELVFDIKLSEEAKFDFEAFLTQHHLQGQTRLNNAYPPRRRCRFKNQVALPRPVPEEIISQFHPLVRFIGDRIKTLSFVYYSPVSVEVGHEEISGIKRGVYVFTVERWSIQGVREIERLHTAASEISSDFYLTDEEAERLITTAARQGRDWQAAVTEVDFDVASKIADALLAESEAKYESYTQQLEHENNDRADIQEKSLRSHQKRQLERLEALMGRYISEGKEKGAFLTQRRIDALKSRLGHKIEEINRRRELRADKQEICIGLIKII